MKRIAIALIATVMIMLGIAGIVNAGYMNVGGNSGNILYPTDLVSVSPTISHALSPSAKYERTTAQPDQKISVMLTLKFSNQGKLNVLLAGLNDQSSPLYHHYLTASQFQQEFSPSASVYNELVQYYTSQGFQVKTYNDRVSVVLKGTVNQFDTSFNTNIMSFITHGRTFIAPISSVMIPAFLQPYLVNIAGLNTHNIATLNINRGMFTTSSGSQLLYGSDMQNAYQLNKLYSGKGYPTNETIATILWSGTNSAGHSVAPFVPSDIYSYYNKTIPSGEPHSSVYGAPIGGAPAPGPSASTDQSQANFESTLDLEMAGSTAPGATIVEVYGPQATQACLDQSFAFILNPSSSYPQLNNVVAISNSWGGSDGTHATWTSYEQEATARGITVFASSGDGGNTNSAAPSFPATDAYNTYGITAVGGLQTTVSGTASTTGTGTTGISTESVWYNTPNSGDGSQGGVSKYYAEPTWQKASSEANSVITGASSITGVSSGRGTPDISADGANMEIWITYSGSTSYQELWGTSIASPLDAGLFATMDYYVGHKMGFIDPLIYQLAQAQYNGSLSSSPAFYFVSNGSNGDFSATGGYSLAIGWGSVEAYNFAQDYINGIPTSSPPPTNTNTTTTSNTILSIVNDTASSISTYTLPEAEEFQVNQTHIANNVVLYLSGSGSIAVSIGTKLFGTQIMSKQTFSISGAAKWYQLFFSNISLSTGTNYFLNVNLVSGSTQWGYVSSPPVDVGATQDYWYSGSTLVNDNSYPDVYSIGYYAQQASTSPSPSPSPNPTGVFVEVNATASNINVYALPEAEKFTVSSNVAIDYVVLYLSGSGQISIAIGSTIFGAQVLAKQTYTVSGTAGFYRIAIPTTSLTSGTNYFLNLHLVSGSTQWGYTSSPSVDTGALQDYWYSGGTLYHDNTYPDIFSLGYS